MKARTFDRRTPGPVVMNHRRAWWVGPSLYRVFARDGVTKHYIPVVAGVPRCPCEAGRWRKPCVHAAVVLRRLLREGRA